MSRYYFKDELYYYDLIYQLKKIYGRICDSQIEEETETRIKVRENDIITIPSKEKGRFKTDFRMSLFNMDINSYIRKIQNEAFKKISENPEIKFYGAVKNIKHLKNNINIVYLENPEVKIYYDTFNLVIQELEEKKRNAKKQKSSPKRRIKKIV